MAIEKGTAFNWKDCKSYVTLGNPMSVWAIQCHFGQSDVTLYHCYFDLKDCKLQILCLFGQSDVTLYHCYFDFKDYKSYATLYNPMSLYFISALIYISKIANPM